MTDTPTPARHQHPEPTAAERETIARAKAASTAKRPARLRVQVNADRGGSISTPHTDVAGWLDHLAAATGSSSEEFQVATVSHLQRALARPRQQVASPDDLNAALALIESTEPQNELQAALAVQIAAAHSLSLDCMARAATADTIPARDQYISQAAKVSNIMSRHLEALQKLKGGGQQKVTVIHEHRHTYYDNRGGQTVIHGGPGGGGVPDFSTQPHELGGGSLSPTALAYADGAQVWSADASGEPVQANGNPGKGAV